jgi:tight adherence protein B
MENGFLYYAFVTLAFFAVVLLLEGAYLAWNTYRGPEAKRIERRIQAMSAGGMSELTIVKKRLLSDVPAVDRLLLSIPRIHVVDRMLLQSGLNINTAKFLAISLILAILAWLVTWLFGFPGVIKLLIVIVGGAIPTLYVLRAKEKRLLKIGEQLPDSLDLMGRALRAGHAFPSALQMVATEGPQPIAGEFHICFDELNFGIPIQDALVNLATRVPSTDLRYFVIAVLIQRETGGNLAELLDKIAMLIRDRLKLLGTIRVLSAEGRLSAWILTLLPFGLAILLNVINPRFMSVLWTDPMGQRMVGGALLMMVVGIFWMWRTVKIRV